MIKNPKRNCANCGKLFVPNDARSLYCRKACRTAACRKRKKVEQVSGTSSAIATNPATIWETRSVTVEVRNPKFTELEAVLVHARSKVAELEKEESRLKATRKGIEEDSAPTDTNKYYRPGLVWGGSALLMGLCTSMVMPTKPNTDPENESNPVEGRALAVFALVLISIVAGIIIAGIQRSNRAKKFPEILQRLEALPKEIEQAERLVTRLNAELEAIPQTIEQEKDERYAVAESMETETETAEELEEANTEQ